MASSLLYLAVGLILLILSAERFVFGASALARNLRVSPLLVGVIIVGFGTSMPEVLVSGIAAWQGNPGLAIGNALGSNIANIALILGIAALVRPLAVHSTVLRRELPILLAAMLTGWVLLSNGRIDRVDGVLLLAAFAGMMYWMVSVARSARLEGVEVAVCPAEQPGRSVSSRHAVLWSVVGLAVLLASSRLLVWAAVDLAHALGVDDLIVGLTIVAVGTSLPELASAVAAAFKREDDLIIGNIVGSNSFNTLVVLGLPGIIAPGAFAPEVLTRDVPFMVLLTVALFVMAYGPASGGRVNRLEGGVLLGSFVVYQWILFG
jgi:cation:H+ antiporter